MVGEWPISSTAVALDLSREGTIPRLAAAHGDAGHPVVLFSDLKRHDLGDGLAEARDDRGVDRRLFRTPPLWGLARSAPYLHDGRAPNIEAAILAHGGEAAPARRRYEEPSEEDRAGLRVFLTSLSRARRLVAG